MLAVGFVGFHTDVSSAIVLNFSVEVRTWLVKVCYHSGNRPRQSPQDISLTSRPRFKFIESLRQMGGVAARHLRATACQYYKQLLSSTFSISSSEGESLHESF